VRLAAVLSAACAAVMTVVLLAGCGTGGFSSEGGQSAGRQLFLDAGCGACHTLADAGTGGTIGPNLDDAFAQARADGMTSDTFTQVVAGQVRYPIEDPSTEQAGMPGVNETLPRCEDVAEEGAFCVEDQDGAVQNIAAYVGAVAGTGATAPPPPGGGEATDGQSIFTANCAACHTLADAGTTGTVGPNLDQARPSQELAVDRVTNGRGAMPAFEGSLSPAQIEAVAEYVATSAGR
jgi:mono/diheme cytochrome c family protein